MAASAARVVSPGGLGDAACTSVWVMEMRSSFWLEILSWRVVRVVAMVCHMYAHTHTHIYMHEARDM